jgi:hypothetical protein
MGDGPVLESWATPKRFTPKPDFRGHPGRSTISGSTLINFFVNQTLSQL